MHLKQYLIDLTIICTTVSVKIFASFTGLTFGISMLDLIGKSLYILVLLITGFTASYRFFKELKADKTKSEDAKNKE